MSSQSQWVRAPVYHGEEHGSRQGDMVLEQEVRSHKETQTRHKPEAERMVMVSESIES